MDWSSCYKSGNKLNFPLMLACETRILPGSIFYQWHPSLWWKLLNVRSLMVSLPLGVGRQHWTVLWRCIRLESSRSTTLKSWDTRFLEKWRLTMNLLKVMYSGIYYIYIMYRKESAKLCWESCIIGFWWLSFVEKVLQKQHIVACIGILDTMMIH